MSTFRAMGLKQKLVVTLALLGIGPAVLMAWLSYSASAGSMTASVGRTYAQMAATVHDTIDRNLFERYGDVQAFGVNQVVRDRSGWYKPGSSANAVADMANTYVSLYGIYALSMVVDTEGRLIAVNDKDAAGKSLDTDFLYQERFADASWFRDALASRFLVASGSALTGTVVEDAREDAAVKRVFGGDGETITFTAPVRDGSGRVIAVWHNRAAFSVITDIVKASYDALAAKGYPGASVTVFDARGQLLAAHGPKAGDDGRSIDADVVKQALSGTAGHAQFDHETRGALIAGYAQSTGALGYAGLKWGAVVAVPADEALAEVVAMRNQAMLLVAGCLVVLIALAVWLGRSIARPMMANMATLSDGARQVTAAAGQVSASAQTLSQGATEQAASLQETSASMEEMAAMTRRNAENSQKAAGLMVEMDHQVGTFNVTLREMVTSMDGIKESSSKVAKIIKTIDEIAFQTNILALNAAVEAARAGEAGMGFAVVADEVRNLAQRSAQAAKDTAALIEESSATATAGLGKVTQVAAATEAITTSVAAVKQLVDDVSTASREQAQGIEQVSQAMSQMEKVTQSSAATAEENAAASEELSAQAETATATIATLGRMVSGRADDVADGGAPLQRPARIASFFKPAAKATTRRASFPAKSHQAAEDFIPFDDTGTGV